MAAGQRVMNLRAAAFLDRDGVVNIDHGYTARIEEFEFVPGTLAAARTLAQAGYALVVITNQSGIGRGLYSLRDFEQLTDWMRARFAQAGAPLAGVYFCPHHPTEAPGEYRRNCDCRKPAPGMLLAAARELALDLSRSILFGDRDSDLLAAQAAGVPQRVLLGTNGTRVPAADSPLATARFRSLADAVAAMNVTPANATAVPR
jgi:D-glycero-D-manno-heptose 1,7-bisphosphate phosphatase